ncbi:MAG: CHASE2 domain-containing protein [Lacibacter sp.]
MKFLKKFFTEYLLLNLFIFGCVSLLSLAIINISFFDPFTEAFRDFSLTDLYYTKEKDRNQINKGPVVLINVEDKDRSQVAYLLQQVQKGKPKVVALDIVYAQRINQQDSLLKAEFTSHNNYVFSYIADFDNLQESIYTDSFFTTQRDGYATMVADNIEYSTIRHYYPFNDNMEAFTSAIIKKYDSALYQQLLKRKNKKTEIHYTGNLSNFSYYDFDEVTDPDFDASALQNKIVLLGYLGMPKVNAGNRQDEDKFFTPLNSRLSGRSHPDMYGCVIHANILRMILDKDYIKVVPPWRVFLVSFIILWMILPFMCGLFFKGDLWFNSVGTLVQLIGSFFIVAASVFTYKYFNTKFDPGLLTGCLVLLPTFINLYEALLMFLRYKLKIRFRSAFLSKDHND